MKSISINFDSQITEGIYKRYFKFERKRFFKNVPVTELYLSFGIFTVLGVLFDVFLILILGAISLSLFSIYIGFHYLQFALFVKRGKKYLNEMSGIMDNHYEFSFNDEMMIYKSENTSSETKWAMVDRYDINEGDVYLFLKEGRLFDIISGQIIGQDNYQAFLGILASHVNTGTR